MHQIKTLLNGVLAGICISIGGTVFLSLDNKVLGALFFTIGLFVICTHSFNLFTGKVCYALENKVSYIFDLLIIWIGNFLGTVLVAKVLLLTRIGPSLQEKAISLVNVKLNDSLLSIFILAFFCNICIYIAVDGYKNNKHELGKYLAIFFGVMVFILCGFEHVVANMYYFSLTPTFDLNMLVYLLVMTLGNACGGLFIPLIKKITCKE